MCRTLPLHSLQYWSGEPLRTRGIKYDIMFFVGDYSLGCTNSAAKYFWAQECGRYTADVEAGKTGAKTLPLLLLPDKVTARLWRFSFSSVPTLRLKTRMETPPW